MFKLRTGCIATDRDGVQENLSNNVLTAYISSAGSNGQKQKDNIELNGSVTMQEELNLFCSMKGE